MTLVVFSHSTTHHSYKTPQSVILAGKREKIAGSALTLSK